MEVGRRVAQDVVDAAGVVRSRGKGWLIVFGGGGGGGVARGIEGASLEEWFCKKKKNSIFDLLHFLKFVCLVCGCVRITNGFGYQFLCNPTLSDCQHGLRNLIWVKKLKKQFLSGLSLF